MNLLFIGVLVAITTMAEVNAYKIKGLGQISAGINLLIILVIIIILVKIYFIYLS